MVWLLSACTGPSDSGSTKDSETGTPDERTTLSAAAAEIQFVGASNDGAGGAVAIGEGIVAVGAQLGSRVCAWTAPVPTGANTLDAAPRCWLGDTRSDYAGTSVDIGVDADDSGEPQLLIGAIGHSGVATNAGAAYLVRASTSGALADGVLLEGEAAGDYAGTAVRFAGDLDGDGLTEVLIGAPGNDRGGAGAGAVYLLHGPVGDQALAEARTRFVGTGEATTALGPPPPPHGAPSEGDGVGAVFDLAGDLDGDGLTDLLLGANGSDTGGADAGAVAVVLGPMPEGEVAWADTDQRWIGVGPSSYAGDEVVGGADLDGDGYDDFVSVEQGATAGVLRVVSGPGSSGEHSLNDVAIVVSGVTSQDQAGADAELAGDVDGDGAADLLVGAYQSDAPEPEAGAVYLVLGPIAPGNRTLADAAVTWIGDQNGGWLGRAVAGGDDVDGDGLPDLVMGAPYDDGGGVFAGGAWLWTAASLRAVL